MVMSIVKSVRMVSDLWVRVEARALEKGLSANACAVSLIEAGLGGGAVAAVVRPVVAKPSSTPGRALGKLAPGVRDASVDALAKMSSLPTRVERKRPSEEVLKSMKPYERRKFGWE